MRSPLPARRLLARLAALAYALRGLLLAYRAERASRLWAIEAARVRERERTHRLGDFSVPERCPHRGGEIEIGEVPDALLERREGAAEDSLRRAMARFTEAGWPTEEWPVDLWEDAARELLDPRSVHRGDLSSLAAHFGLWN